MSAKALLWARDQHPLNTAGRPDPEAKLLLYALADMDNQNDALNRVWPSQALLRERTSLAVSTIGKRLLLLELSGYITRSRRAHTAGPRKGQRTSDLIILHLEKAPDPPLEAGEQPSGLREANRKRTEIAGTVPARTDPGLEETARRRWEESLGEEWKEEGPWWETAADTVQDLVLVDAASGEVIDSHGPFTNYNRPARRRRPTDLWTMTDVVEEIMDRIRWVNEDNQRDLEVVVQAFRDRNPRDRIDPRAEVLAVAALFESEAFLQQLARDQGDAGNVIVAALAGVYQPAGNTHAAS